MHKLYQDNTWLRKKYLIDKLSIPKIAELCGTGTTVIWTWLHKHSISTRSTSESVHLAQANHCKLSSQALEWINGELLGDGSLRMNAYSALFTYGSKFLEYIQYVSDTLKTFGVEQAGKIYATRHKVSECITYCYRSRSYVELLSLYEKWYPEGKKVVPKDVTLTRLTCRQWYIDDGSLWCHALNRYNITLSTCGFLVSDVEWLIAELGVIGIMATRQPNNNIIYIAACSTMDFFNHIGDCPVPCYQYKFKVV